MRPPSSPRISFVTSIPDSEDGGIRSPHPIPSRNESRGISHEFVRENYVKGADGRRRVYLPALLHENPGVDQEEYRRELEELDPITRKQLEDGDWDVHLSGGFFEVEKIVVVFGLPWTVTERVRAWDLAATPAGPGLDPDWTVGALLATDGSETHIEDIQRIRAGPADVDRRIRETAERDGLGIPILIEQEPGSSGLIVRRHFATDVLLGYDYRSRPQTGSKYDRAKPLAAAVSNGLVSWNRDDPNRLDCFAELRAFNEDPKTYAHDDVVDAVAMGYNELHRPKTRRMRGEIA